MAGSQQPVPIPDHENNHNSNFENIIEGLINPRSILLININSKANLRRRILEPAEIQSPIGQPINRVFIFTEEGVADLVFINPEKLLALVLKKSDSWFEILKGAIASFQVLRTESEYLNKKGLSSKRSLRDKDKEIEELKQITRKLGNDLEKGDKKTREYYKVNKRLRNCKNRYY